MLGLRPPGRHLRGGGGEAHGAEEFGVPFLGRIPLEIETRKGGDTGMPITVGAPTSQQAAARFASRRRR